MANDVFGKCLALEPGQSLELHGDDECEFFNWQFPHTTIPREHGAILGFLRMHGLNMESDAQQHCWRISKPVT